MSFLRLCPTVFLTVLFTSEVFAENWPCWRGPRGDGSSDETNVPTTWNGVTGDNIAWKAAIPGVGHASPVVWGDRIFLVSCLEEEKRRLLICLDRSTGKELWQKDVVQSVLETKHQLNSHASGTPATDGERIYVTFLVTDGSEVPAPNVGTQRPVTPGQMLVAAYDFDGKQLWTATPGDFTSVHGFCSSPVLYEKLVIVNGDHDGDSYVAALDKATGNTVWKVSREHKTRSYCTPIIRRIDGKDQLVMSGSKRVVGMDPETGKTVWLIEGPTEQFVSSMVYDGSRFYMTAGFPTHHVMSIQPDGSGDVTDTHVTWHSTEAKCYVPSPVVIDHYLMVADDRGTANCFDTKTGDRLWQDRMGNHYSASLLSAGGLAYFIADDGIAKVIRPGAIPEVLHENPLGEFCFASPAVSHGQIFLRGEKHLFAIGKQH